MIFDAVEAPDTKESIETSKQEAIRQIQLWRRRSLYTVGSLLLSCALAVPFQHGYPLQAYWDSFGKSFVMLAMALLVPSVICVAIAINSWNYLRNLRKIEL
jgi:hypothetical protein